MKLTTVHLGMVTLTELHGLKVPMCQFIYMQPTYLHKILSDPVRLHKIRFVYHVPLIILSLVRCTLKQTELLL